MKGKLLLLGTAMLIACMLILSSEESNSLSLQQCISHVSSYDINANDMSVEGCIKQFNLHIDATTGEWSGK
jgi:hypothetical protein